MTRRIPLALLLVALASTARADDDLINPDRPGIADGSAVVGSGVIQIETGVDRTRDDLSTPSLVRYGLSKALEMRLESDGFTRARGGGDDWAPVSVGAKWHFSDAPSLGMIVRMFVPSGTGELKQKQTTGEVRLAADFNLGEKWSVNPNVGVASEIGGRRFTAGLAAMTVQYNVSERAGVFVDGAVQSPEERHGATSLQLDAGGAIVVGRDTQLDGSATWRAHGRTAPDLTLSAGISHRF
jgi:hypothetical protein